MMTKEDAEVVKLVYNRFMNNETETWENIDCNLEIFDWLTDKEVLEESEIRFEQHSKSKIFRCCQDHDQQYCFAPYILEAVRAILSLSKRTGFLHIKNRYILVYYLVMSETSVIFSA